MSADTWVEDESHQTINGERWVARECEDCCGGIKPDCELFSPHGCECGKLKEGIECCDTLRQDRRNVRWYRANSPTLAFFDKPTEDVAKAEKPPLGLKPRYIHDHERYIEICGAIQRHYDAGKKIPVEWIEEYNELVEKEKCE